MIRAKFELAYPGFSLQAALDIPARGVTALFGPSGSGKTMLLRCIAGLEHPVGGYLEVNGETWQDEDKSIFLPTHQRSLGYVFQEASLFPHMSVRRNLEYGYARTPPAERKVAWNHAVDLLEIGPLLQRATDRLSGGERQRIAIARAVLASPGLLLMDEPLAALDNLRKREILPFLERLHQELSIPVLYVSHQIDEVTRLADQLVLLDAGRIIASGPLAETLARLDLPTAQDEDAGVVIEARAAAHDARYHLTRLDFSGGGIYVAHSALALGQDVRLRIQARDVSLALAEHQDTSILNRFPATVMEFAGTNNPANVMVRLDAAGTPLLARLTRRSQHQLDLAVGRRVWVQVKTVALME